MISWVRAEQFWRCLKRGPLTQHLNPTAGKGKTRDSRGRGRRPRPNRGRLHRHFDGGSRRGRRPRDCRRVVRDELLQLGPRHGLARDERVRDEVELDAVVLQKLRRARVGRVEEFLDLRATTELGGAKSVFDDFRSVGMLSSRRP